MERAGGERGYRAPGGWLRTAAAQGYRRRITPLEQGLAERLIQQQIR